MDQPPNGAQPAPLNGKVAPNLTIPIANGVHEHELTLEELERELPVVHDGQVPLGELVSRMAQTIYAELTELAETMPNMSDVQRKRTLAEWVVKTKKQVVKLYAVVRWARDADVVQKAMNVTAFLMDQNRQFEEAIHGLTYAKESLDPARLRNHDLLTSLDVLTTGTYQRLPTKIKESIIPPIPLTDEEVTKTLQDIEDAMRYRLRMTEVIPLEMAKYRITDGRVYFNAPKLFEASLCLHGARKDDGWFFADVEFLFTVGGDPTGMQEFPRKPTSMLRRQIADEADARLAFYLPMPPEQEPPPPGVEVPPRPQLPEGVVDTPLVRVFNFLQMMSMSYQLEILWYQAERMRSLGWADYLNIEMSNNRRTLTLAYWVRKPPPDIPGRPRPPQGRSKLPPQGGTLTISIVPSPTITYRSPKSQVLAELQQRAKLGDKSRPSDEVEGLRFDVRWDPQRDALGVTIPPEAARIVESDLTVDPDDLDIESLLKTVIRRHTKAILHMFQHELQHGRTRNVFSHAGAVTLIAEDGSLALRTHLCADEVVITTIDPRTGRLNLHDTGDLAAASRGPKLSVLSDRLNESPVNLPGALLSLRLSTITDLAEQKASYLGLQSYRFRNFSPEETRKFGQAARGMLYIQLSMFHNHYLVLVITDTEFRYALITVKVLTDPHSSMVMEDIVWLVVERIHGEEIAVFHRPRAEPITGQKRKRELSDLGGRLPADEPSYPSSSFKLESEVLRELYAYCCARVSYTKVEQQFKLRGIPYTHVNPAGGSPLPPELAHLQSSLSRSIPALCVQSSDILSGAPAAEAAMPNIRVIPLNWWSDHQAQVVTCVKLKYVQQPVGKRAGSSAVIRPSKRIIYDTTEAIVSFLSEDVDKCVDEFLEEWARVSKMVVIAREVAQMSTTYRWNDVRLLSFDLTTVEFAYSADYTVSITCVDQLSPTGGSYQLRFSRPRSQVTMRSQSLMDGVDNRYNPHSDVEPFMRNILRHGRLAPSLHRLVALLRDTLPIVLELQDIRESASKAGETVDTFAKAAGWFRVLYGDLRHALDFRLMKDARVVILDGSYSLFHVDDQSPKVFTRFTTPLRDNMLVLQPIPNFTSIVTDVVKDASVRRSGGMVSAIGIGVVCDASAVRSVGRGLYERVMKNLKETEG